MGVSLAKGLILLEPTFHRKLHPKIFFPTKIQAMGFLAMENSSPLWCAQGCVEG